MPKDAKTILVVEDEPALQLAIREKCTAEGFTVLSAENGITGLHMAMQEHPDLILLDIIMPRMDGLEMLEELRKDTWGATAKVIMLTNLNDDEKVAKAAAFNVFDYLVKADWNIADVVDKIKQTLGLSY